MKPPYKVPLMSEIKETEWNGYNAISTFSGCGGSSLGYRMAGFRVLWANEFIQAARDTYNANKADYTILDGRDIRDVNGSDILNAIKMKSGDLDLFDGSPPCASFSTAGKREAGWGKIKKYSDTKQRTDDLFFEYIRLVKDVMPKVFVAENVSGLVKGTAKGYFLEILKAMKAAGYKVSCRVLDAQWLGVPQMRQRAIFIGVRNDIGIDPVHPKPLSYRYSVKDALPHIDFFDMGRRFGEVEKRSADKSPYMTIGNGACSGNGLATKVYARAVHDTSGNRSQGGIADSPSPTVTVGVNSVNSNHYQIVSELEKRKFSIAELRRICAFPDDFILTGTYAQQWERMGRAVPPVMMYHIAKTVRDEILCKIK